MAKGDSQPASMGRLWQEDAGEHRRAAEAGTADPDRAGNLRGGSPHWCGLVESPVH